MRHPLDGVTVVSLEQAVAAPFATRQLADLGARVIKIERPGDGDFARGYDRTTRGLSSYFAWLNRGKESVELDVKDPADRELIDRLIDGADVFVQNLAPGAADRLGLGPSALRAERHRLICCSVSGYGADGPYRLKKAYDLLVQCETGLVMATGTPEAPSKAGISVADIAAGMYAYSGILTALYDRERTGRGTALQVAMIDALSEWMTQPAYFSHYGQDPPRRTGARHPSISPYGPFRVSDGSIFFGIQNEREWLVFCRDLLGRAGLATDPRFASNPDRSARNDELTAIIEDSFAGRTADEVSEALEAAGIACARLRVPGDLVSHPELRARGRWRPVRTPGGDIDALLPPVRAAGQRPVMGAVPARGEHTEAVRAEFRARGDVLLPEEGGRPAARARPATMATAADLNEAVENWKPEPVETSEVIGAWPAAAFSAMLDLPGPVAREGDPLPPLWHWFHFLETPRQSELGEDGHPAGGRFMPPVPDRRRMIAGGRVQVRSPILIGERVIRRSELTGMTVKEGRSGQMVFVTVRHEFRRGYDDVLLTEEQDIVYRSQPAGRQRQLPDGAPDAEPRHDWRIAAPIGPELLFRFSALTYNTHRIHYDEPYVTGVEGYPGLVVHGPLLALLLLEIPRRHSDRPVRSFEYRLSSPVFAGSTVLTHGRLGDDGQLALSAMVAGGRTSITGSAALW